MSHTFTEYRSRASKTLWSKYSLDRVCRDHRFRVSRFDNICADHWKHDAEIFTCVEALESYLIPENIAFKKWENPMKVLKLRQELHKLGLVLLEHGDNWMVTNNGTAKTLTEQEFKNLDDVQMWLDSPARRLTEKECELFEDEFTEFANKERNNAGN